MGVRKVIGGTEGSNRGFQEIIRGGNEKGDRVGFINTIGLSATDVHHNYLQSSAAASLHLRTQQNYNPKSTTLGSSRQSA